MIWFSSSKLETALSNDSLSYWGKAKYLVFFAVITALLGYPLSLVRPVYGERVPALSVLFAFPSAILSAYIAYKGIKKCFLINEGIDGRFFFERMACLSVPVWTRLMIFVFPVIIGLSWAFALFKSTRPELFNLFQNFFNVLSPVWFLVYYVLLKRSFDRLGGLLKKQEIN